MRHRFQIEIFIDPPIIHSVHYTPLNLSLSHMCNSVNIKIHVSQVQGQAKP